MEDRKPAWLKVRPPGHGAFAAVRRALDGGRLHTVCEEARCPNRGECWGAGTATLLVLGDTCTRGCRFCSVRRGVPGPVDEAEPERVAECARSLGLRHVVITGVTRDDLPDGGASVFARSIRAVHDLPGAPRVEVLIPDYRGAPLAAVLAARPDVLAHNVEVVRRLTPDVRHPRCDYDRSLGTLAESKRIAPDVPTKSSILLGLGETRDEVVATLRDLRGAGADLVVLGQYLRPTRENVEVARYVPPAEFDSLRAEALAIGFAEAVAAPLARTSYRAAEAFARSVRAGGAA